LEGLGLISSLNPRLLWMIAVALTFFFCSGNVATKVQWRISSNESFL